MKLVAILRIKNSIRTVNKCLTKLSQLCDEIVIVDNRSTDGTLAAYKKYSKIVCVEKTSGFDESRDRNLALEIAKKKQPEWIIWIDADEIFEKSLTREILNNYMKTPDLAGVTFRMFNFWLQKQKYRVDGKWLFYTARPQRMMWRNTPSAHFSEKKFHGGGILGINGKIITSPYRIRHFGYVYKDVIEARNERCNKLAKKYPQWDKTLITNINDKVKLKIFREFSNKIINLIYIKLIKIKWDILEKIEGIV